MRRTLTLFGPFRNMRCAVLGGESMVSLFCLRAGEACLFPSCKDPSGFGPAIELISDVDAV